MRLPERALALATAATAAAVVTASMLASHGELAAPSASSISSGPDGPDGSPKDPVIHVPAVRAGQARVAERLATRPLSASALAHLDIPPTALLAYQRAVRVMDLADPSCRLSWTLLAAIGRVESDHGRFGGALLAPDGVSTPVIRGAALDGRGRLARVPDTDGGRLDGDPKWDRAVGPMQILPATWAVVAVDADGDGVRSPDDLDDASLAAAVFLCSGPGDLGTVSGERAAVFRYNPSQAYVAEVLTIQRAYRTGDYTLLGEPVGVGPVQVVAAPAQPGPQQTQHPSGDGPGPSTDARVAAAGPPGGSPAGHGTSTPSGSAGPHRSPPAAPSHDPSHDPSHSPSHHPSQDPSSGSTASTPPPPDDPRDPATPGTPSLPDPTTPEPTTPDPTTPDPGTPAPDPVTLAGVLDHCDAEPDAYCLDGTLLDVGDPAYLASPATADLDADGTVESNADELEGLLGTEATLQVVAGTSPAVVLTVNGAPYRTP